MKGSKMLSMLVVFALVLSSLIVSNVVAERHVEPDVGYAKWIISNNGFGTLANNLTCGEIITLYITNNSLPKNTDYRMRVWNGNEWRNLTTTGNRQSDMYGDLSISFRVPGWGELGKNPVKENATNGSAGTWNISLFSDDYKTQIFTGLNVTIKIGNLYYLKFYEGNNEINNLVYNKEYSAFKVKIFNWTGSQLVEAKDDTTKYKFNVSLCNYSNNPPGGEIENLGTGITNGVTNSKGLLIKDVITDSDKEKTLWVRVNHSDDNTLNSSVALPVLLNVTLPSPPTNVKWGDPFTVSGKVLDGQGTGLKSYKVRVYYPVSGGYNYDEVTTPSTVTTGTYSLSFETGSGKGFGAGTWYVGTYASTSDRVNKSNEPPYIEGFIPYYSFEVGTKDTATVTVHSTEEITKRFWHNFNISVKNESWMTNEFRKMNIHITGVEGYDGTRSYNRSDIVLLNATPKGLSNDKRCYYEFKYMFNETGTATIWVSWPGNLTSFDYHDSSYNNTYGNESTSLIANITGKTTVSVVSPGAMTVIANNVPDAVEIKDASCGGGWVNKSQSATDGMWTNISVYGSTQDSYKNATIQVSGCGLSFTINETDTKDNNEYLINKGHDDTGNGSWYNISIIPKIAGTLTITVTNGTNTVVKDYEVSGLTGTITTSKGDDLKITVGTTETITLTGLSNLAKTKITYFNESWTCLGLLNESENAGEFEFTPDANDIDQVGYIVVVAGSKDFGLYMYDIIKVVPVYDFTVDVITPTAGNQTLTVGYGQDVVVHLLDSQNNSVTKDKPTVIAKLVDDDHNENDPLQTFAFSDSGGGEFEAKIHPYWPGQLIITGCNASDAIKHSGNTTLNVDYATITYVPAGTTAGIGVENLTVNVSAVDANGNPLEDVTTISLYVDDNGGGFAWDTNNNHHIYNISLTDGTGEFEIATVGDNATTINATLQYNAPSDGNKTLGVFTIAFPTFVLNPDTIYVGKSNLITIVAKDYAGNALDGIWLTLSPTGTIADEPDPVETDSDGMAEFSVDPSSSGKLNVTIVKDINDRSQDVTTDTYVTVTHLRELTMTFSKSPIYKGDTLIVTVKSGGSPVEDVGVTIGETTNKTDSDGKATFTAPDPGIADSITLDVTAEKTGYISTSKSLTIINKFDITIIPPSGDIEKGKTYSFTVVANGKPLAGATVTLEGKTYTSGGDGTVSLTVPDKEGTYTITATLANYNDGTLQFTVVTGKGTPGFELLTLVIALGVAFILLRRRRK